MGHRNVGQVKFSESMYTLLLVLNYRILACFPGCTQHKPSVLLKWPFETAAPNCLVLCVCNLRMYLGGVEVLIPPGGAKL